MKHHQKYFPLCNPDGKLQPYFLSVHNSDPKAAQNIKTGNERVLQARLSDAQFFWNEDTQTSLESKLNKLSGLLFQAKLGNYDRKVERIQELSKTIAIQLDLKPDEMENILRSAKLCKADLVTEMVKEFPELQGIVGKYYALHDRENPLVAEAIQDHYLPKGSDFKLPGDNISAVVSIADKIDTIVGCFGGGFIPSGSEDPFALRRAGNGIIRIILANPEWSISISRILNSSAELYQSTVGIDAKPSLVQVTDFLCQRLRAFLMESGIRYDTADAVLTGFFDDVNDAYRRAEALHNIRATDGFIPLTIAFKRVINILKQAREKFSLSTFGNVDISRFQDEPEHILNNEIQKVTASIQKEVSEKRYLDSLKTIAALRTSVDLFFDKVMVMVENESVRKNRLALLEQLEKQFRQLADFSQLVVEE